MAYQSPSALEKDSATVKMLAFEKDFARVETSGHLKNVSKINKMQK